MPVVKLHHQTMPVIKTPLPKTVDFKTKTGKKLNSDPDLRKERQLKWGLTWKFIWSNSEVKVKKRANNVKIHKLRKVVNKANGAEIYQATSRSFRDDSGNMENISGVDHFTYLERRGQYVKTSCSCQNFTYGGAEFGLNKRNAAEIRYSNGKAPDIKDPQRKALGCKHSLALIKLLASKGILK